MFVKVIGHNMRARFFGDTVCYHVKLLFWCFFIWLNGLEQISMKLTKIFLEQCQSAANVRLDVMALLVHIWLFSQYYFDIIIQ